MHRRIDEKHPELRGGEYFVGHINKDHPEGSKEFEDIKGLTELKSIRFGTIVLNIHGDTIHRDDVIPVFMKKIAFDALISANAKRIGMALPKYIKEHVLKLWFMKFNGIKGVTDPEEDQLG